MTVPFHLTSLDSISFKYYKRIRGILRHFLEPIWIRRIFQLRGIIFYYYYYYYLRDKKRGLIVVVLHGKKYLQTLKDFWRILLGFWACSLWWIFKGFISMSFFIREIRALIVEISIDVCGDAAGFFWSLFNLTLWESFQNLKGLPADFQDFIRFRFFFSQKYLFVMRFFSFEIQCNLSKDSSEFLS